MLLLTALAACRREERSMTPAPISSHPEFIPVDTAAKMTGSYLSSINYQTNDTNLRSVIFSAAALRYYLDSLPNSDSIKSIEISFAHTLNFINSGNQGVFAGYNRNALTLVIKGLNQSGQYIYADNHVINRGTPCPLNCPPSLTGSSPEKSKE